MTETLFPAIRTYLQKQEAVLFTVAAVHQASLQKLGAWLKQRARQHSDIVIVCTGNSRRSILTSTLGNCIAAYRGWSGVRFHSAGTEPSAFNPRTVTALQQCGLIISPKGSQAQVGKGGGKNPHYRVQWGKAASSEMVEYSKALGDVSLPGKDFAVVMVCTEADHTCPTVEGALLRLAMPFEDPKAFDGTPREVEEYAKTRDLIARTLLAMRVN